MYHKENTNINNTKKWYFKKLNNNEEKLSKLIGRINTIIVNFPYTNNMYFPEADSTLILDHIWLGNYHVSGDIYFVKNERIEYIINITNDIPNKFYNINYITLPINDIDACASELINMMDYAADIINKAVSEKKSILIHCKRGHHRSASIVAYYLMKYYGLSLEDAILLIKSKRPTTFKRMTCMLKTLIYYEYNRMIQFSKNI